MTCTYEHHNRLQASGVKAGPLIAAVVENVTDQEKAEIVQPEWLVLLRTLYFGKFHDMLFGEVATKTMMGAQCTVAGMSTKADATTTSMKDVIFVRQTVRFFSHLLEKKKCCYNLCSYPRADKSRRRGTCAFARGAWKGHSGHLCGPLA
jgi:hypothetical protein